MFRNTLLAIALASGTSPANADPAQILDIDASDDGNAWTFSVTLTHPDSSWDHYADGWRVETPDGQVLAVRVLYHPHVDEQPFTRSLSGVEIPAGLQQVFLRARDNVDGWSEDRVAVDLK